MSRPRITPAAAADVDAVMRVMDAAFDPAFGEAWNRGQVLGILSLGDVWLSLATPADGETAEGFALSRRVLDEAELLLLAVTPDARRLGIGRALLDDVAAEATLRGATRLMLEMRDGNPAEALYAGAGFAEIGRRRDYYRGRDNALYDAVTLARPLVPDPSALR